MLRWVLAAATGSTSIYGPLAAPIVILIWLYLVSIAVLIGAALNAAVDHVWPPADGGRARHVRPHARENPVTPVRATP